MNEELEDRVRDEFFEVLRHRIGPIQITGALIDNVEMFAEGNGDYLVQQLETEFLSHNLAENEVKYPADWWEHFKERWFPEWAKQRWPVRYRTERIEIHALFPYLPVPAKGRQWSHVLRAERRRVRDAERETDE